ncbi:MAG: glycosyltransferase family 39 protein [Flavobacteriales bacterium]|nr:glycosyltransferase family 39 protein [Flavobacteriales bacterium]
MIQENPDITLRDKRKWLLIILAIKLMFFIYWAVHYDLYSKAGLVKNHLAVELADTDTYYNPIDTWVKQGVYPNMCRMPGLAPVYAPFYILFGKQVAYIAVIVFQFLFSTLAAYCLAIVASRMCRWRFAFQTTAVLSAMSAFVSVWDHVLLSDSLSVSFLIFSLYHFTGYFTLGKPRSLLYAGFWLTWSMFIRQIAVIGFPIALLILFIAKRKQLFELIKYASLFLLSLLVIDGWWMIRNYKQEQIFVPLVKPIADCWQSYSKPFMAINDLQITWGEDVQYWIAGSSAAWFNQASPQAKPYPFRKAIMTSICNHDSILTLQHTYAAFRTEKDSLKKNQLEEKILSKCADYKKAYIAEHAADYWLVKRGIMLGQFVFPLRHDNLPGPSFAEMNIIQKAIKSGFLLLLLLINFLAVIAMIYALFTWKKSIMAFALLPSGIITFLAVLLGYIEQRYFLPVYPFFLVIAVWFVGDVLLEKLKKKTSM